MCDALLIFEGTSTGRRPAFRSSKLSSGLLKVVGKMVGHCYLMDVQGFPYLSKACFYYICDRVDKALTLLTVDVFAVSADIWHTIACHFFSFLAWLLICTCIQCRDIQHCMFAAARG